MLAQNSQNSKDLFNWINSEDLSKCLCGVKYSIPGLDSSLCKFCGWQIHRHELVRQYCEYGHLEKGKSLKLNPDDLTEAQAKTILLKFTKSKSKSTKG
ncbi:hypothetical protein [Planktothrix paucivesiculata]|uniref:hypothetical protein n=1 Tax=Planktothrix paucivesiculata TaxID=1678308 RepID=UPI0009FB59E7|nr:hypothetical protein [Planktothrix paucivesiculata]